MGYPPIPQAVNSIATQVVDSAYQVHLAVGPGLLESFYEAALAQELRLRGLDVRTQVGLPAEYKGVRLEVGYRIDILVENAVVIEVKACEGLTEAHRAQLLTYLKLTGCRIGFLVNFNVARIKDGLFRYAL